MAPKLRRWLPTTAILGLAALAISAPRTSYVVFQGTFDQSFSAIKAEVGAFYAWYSNSGSMFLVGDGAGGNALLLDDTNQPTGSGVVLAGGFDHQTVVSVGTLTWSFELTFGQIDVPFDAGIVVDSPGSDFIPSTGPDGNGDMVAFGKKTGDHVAVSTPMDVTVTLSRDSAEVDWEYSITIADRTASAPPTPTSGRVPDTAGRNILGFAFRKLPGKQGQVLIDDVIAAIDHPQVGGF